MTNKATYKRLGDYIRLADVRNRDLKVKSLLGLSIEKCFIQSIANTIGTDMSTYKVVQPRQFAYGPVTSRNGDKITIALFEGIEPVIISQAYSVFEITDEEQLSPNYLMMWFRRPEFDRYARFKSNGSAREIFDWETMCGVMVPVPNIEEQRRIVSEYQALTKRIELNNQLIAKLEETAQAIYRKIFVDGIDKENLPDGWRMGTLGEIADITSGKTCESKCGYKNNIYVYPVAGASGVIGYSNQYNQDCYFLTTGRVGTLGQVNRYYGKVYTADNVLVIKSVWQEYCFQLLQSFDYEEITKGGVQNLITQTDLKNSPILIPSEKYFSKFESYSTKIYSSVKQIKIENQKINDLQSLLLARMGQ